MLSATDPAAYTTVTRNGQPCLVCTDCRREGLPGGTALTHARNCDLVGGRGKLVGPAAVAVKADAITAAHAAGVCTWTKVGGVWAVTGPEAALRSGTVMVQAKGKQPEQITVSGARQDGARWVAFKTAQTSGDPVYDAYLSGRLSMSAAMNQDF
jgi:hypothetical protein